LERHPAQQWGIRTLRLFWNNCDWVSGSVIWTMRRRGNVTGLQLTIGAGTHRTGCAASCRVYSPFGSSCGLAVLDRNLHFPCRYIFTYIVTQVQGVRFLLRMFCCAGRKNFRQHRSPVDWLCKALFNTEVTCVSLCV
jgi:hypothetical protein